jgi:hypothetical protein
VRQRIEALPPTAAGLLLLLLLLLLRIRMRRLVTPSVAMPEGDTSRRIRMRDALEIASFVITMH